MNETNETNETNERVKRAASLFFSAAVYLSILLTLAFLLSGG